MVGIINKYNKRDSSFELLRILCMLFVIGEHLIGKGMHFTYDNTLLGGEDYCLSKVLHSFCVVAVHFCINFWFFQHKIKYSQNNKNLVFCPILFMDNCNL